MQKETKLTGAILISGCNLGAKFCKINGKRGNTSRERQTIAKTRRVRLPHKRLCKHDTLIPGIRRG